VVASTVKLVRTDAGSRPGLDVGAMAKYGLAHIGLTIRNATQPTLGEGAEAVTLDRQARLGFALSSLGRSSFGGAAIAVDADLTTVRSAGGDERRIAAGGGGWTPKPRPGARAGARGGTIGERPPAARAR